MESRVIDYIYIAFYSKSYNAAAAVTLYVEIKVYCPRFYAMCYEEQNIAKI